MADPTALFTETDARAFNGAALDDSSRYPTAEITAVEATIRAEFARLCRIQFIPTSTTVVLNGCASSSIRLPLHNPLREQPPRYLSITAASIDGVALTAAELADLAAEPNGRVTRKTLGSWLGAAPNIGNVSITARHGYATVPGDIKRAALVVLLAQLLPSEIAPNATSYNDGMMTYQIGYAGDWPHPYGLHEVDAVLLRYREERVTIA